MTVKKQVVPPKFNHSADNVRFLKVARDKRGSVVKVADAIPVPSVDMDTLYQLFDLWQKSVK